MEFEPRGQKTCDRIEQRSLTWPDDVPAVAASFARDGDCVWLDASMSSDNDSDSMLCIEPAATTEEPWVTCCVEPRGAEAREIACSTRFWDRWRKLNSRLRIGGGSTDAAGPGWFGYVAFDAYEPPPSRHFVRQTGALLPRARLQLFDHVVVLKPRLRQALLLSAPHVRAALGMPAVDPDSIRRRWDAACAAPRIGLTTANRPQVRLQCSRAQFEARIERARAYIAAGDVYQVNLAQQLELGALADPFSVFAALRRANATRFGALLRWRECALVSVSPELFLQLRGRTLRTSPVKGTRPRAGDAQADARTAASLLASAKDAAELAMIVDLHRNDLGRVCVRGSIEVEHARRVEAYARVMHTVADIRGELDAGSDGIDALEACFPAGSISGVPKIRALEIIAELESVPRGAYCGAIGWLGLNGNMTWNVAIRTLQMRGSRGVLHVGGGIVADSDAASEYQETLDKARGILEALDAEWISDDS